MRLGGGDDSYTEGPGSVAAGAVDGGDGTDLYRVALAGDRVGLGARTGFEQLAADGIGTLSLALDQDFQSIALNGTNLSLGLGSHGVGRIDGGAGTERVDVDGDVPAVALGAGDDTLSIGATAPAGRYDGGVGDDMLRFTAAGPLTLSGTATEFEAISSAGGALTVAGTLGAPGAPVAFGAGSQSLTVARGGTLAGAVDLGAGDDSFRLAAGGMLAGTVSGGLGADTATLEVADDATLSAAMLTDFERLAVEGGGALTLSNGSIAFDRVDVASQLTIAADASLATPQLAFGLADNRLVIAGAFAGSVDGGAGIDSIEVSGGSTAAPVAFGSIANVEALRMSGGLATLSNVASLGGISLTGGRLVGMAGSTITAPLVTVAPGAIFGSAGTINGNVSVAGTLSPGASPGTMKVNGNVSLAANSLSLFELTPTVSDQLIISGALTVASGATLSLTGERPLTPGAALDLIVADAGITGGFTTIDKSATIQGFVRQSANRIQLLGTFSATGFSPQVTAAIDYTNSVLVAGLDSSALVAAVPTLLTAAGATNSAAFAQLTPEPYASAVQISVENGLTLAQASRTGAAAPQQAEAGPFTFAQGLGNWRKLDGRSRLGTSKVTVHSYGVMGGIGYGSEAGSVGAFVGYLNSRQQVGALGARTGSDGIVVGLAGHALAGGFDLSALLAYDGGRADTQRALPGRDTARGHYHLRGWVADASIGYEMTVGSDWAIKPGVGVTYVSTRRGSAVEIGGGAFGLTVGGRKSDASFIDGSLALMGGQSGSATVHPWASVGVRHQLNGEGTSAAARFTGTAASFSVVGVERKRTLATAAAGIALDLSSLTTLFAGYRGEFGGNSEGHNVTAGFRLRF